MSTHNERVRDNILRNSMADILSEAFKEWYFTEEIKDHKNAKANCELCNQEQLRYHFLIKNRCTNHYLWVGSSCILKFQVQVFDDGQLLDAKQSAKKLNELTVKMRFDACITALKELAASEDNDILSNALDFFLKHQYLTPKYAYVVLWRLDKHKIDHSPSFFKISLNKHIYKEHLENMETYRVHQIWPALSSSQKKLATSYGHAPPPTS